MVCCCLNWSKLFKKFYQFYSLQRFFSKPNFLDFCHGVDKWWLVMKNFEQFFVESIFLLGFFFHWKSRQKYSEMFLRRRYWVLPCKLVRSMYDNLLQKASLIQLQPEASVFLRQFHGFFELVVKRNGFWFRVRHISTVLTS